ncbi:MAG: hypothetical protein IH986_17175 [Planctomycetes bacterium]|nr:hypothetical protein [Planctomycetota bacterium]
MAGDEGTSTCEACGATIYPEHLERHTAGTWQGQLVCPHCLAEKKELAAAGGELSIALEDPPEPPVELADPDFDTPSSEPTPPKRTYGGGGITFDRAVEDKTEYRRPLLKGSRLATRCRTFHCKLNDASVAHLNQQINEWIDGQDDVEIKFAVSNVGIVEGKQSDHHLIMTLFY